MIYVRPEPRCAVWSLARVACSCGHVPQCCGRRTSSHTPARSPHSWRITMRRYA